MQYIHICGTPSGQINYEKAFNKAFDLLEGQAQRKDKRGNRGQDVGACN